MFRSYPVVTISDDQAAAISAEPWCHCQGCANLTNLTAVKRDGRLVVLCRSCVERQSAEGSEG
jgi:hypothetical protein